MKTNKEKKQAKGLPPAPAVAPAALNFEPMPPHLLEEIARGEPVRRPLVEYSEVIYILRHDKKFTFREIAEWLSDHNVETDHNAVYREYTKGMDDSGAHLEELADEEAERKDAGL